MNGNPRANGSRGRDPYAALRLVALIAAITGVIVLAAAAFVLSYGGIHGIALSAGVSASMARIFPVIFDAMLVVSCAAVLSLRTASWWPRTYAWLTTLVLLAAVAAADAVHATGTHIPRKPAAATIAVLPWVLLLVAFSLLLSMLRHFRRTRAAWASEDVTETAGLATPDAPESTAPQSPAAEHTGAEHTGVENTGVENTGAEHTERLNTRGRAPPDRQTPPGPGWTSWNGAASPRSPHPPGPRHSPAPPARPPAPSRPRGYPMHPHQSLLRSRRARRPRPHLRRAPRARPSRRTPPARSPVRPPGRVPLPVPTGRARLPLKSSRNEHLYRPPGLPEVRSRTRCRRSRPPGWVATLPRAACPLRPGPLRLDPLTLGSLTPDPLTLGPLTLGLLTVGRRPPTRFPLTVGRRPPTRFPLTLGRRPPTRFPLTLGHACRPRTPTEHWPATPRLSTPRTGAR